MVSATELNLSILVMDIRALSGNDSAWGPTSHAGLLRTVQVSSRCFPSPYSIARGKYHFFLLLFYYIYLFILFKSIILFFVLYLNVLTSLKSCNLKLHIFQRDTTHKGAGNILKYR